MPQKKIKDLLKESPGRGVGIGNKLQKVNIYLSTIFYIVWIFVGLFASLVVIQSIRSGYLQGIFAGQNSVPNTQVQTEPEATLPGVGKVNVSCVQGALNQEAIQKILEKGDMSDLTEEEKTKLEPCIVEKEAASPSGSPPAQ